MSPSERRGFPTRREVAPRDEPLVHVVCSTSERAPQFPECCYMFFKAPGLRVAGPRAALLEEEEPWSSEGEEDRAFPSSLRARLKAVFASALDIVAPMSALSLEDKGADVSACAASLRALSIEEGHRCLRCQHRFALKKTRDLHMQACTG